MGRHAGWLTAASALARKYTGDNPLLIYLPETAFDQEEFLKAVEKSFEKNCNVIVCVSEGIHDDKGKMCIRDRLYYFLSVTRMIMFSGIILTADGVADIVFLIMIRLGMKKSEKLCAEKEQEENGKEKPWDDPADAGLDEKVQDKSCLLYTSGQFGKP